MLLIKKLSDNAYLPKRATIGSAGYDLFACIDNPVTINKGQTTCIPTKIAIQLEENTVGLLYARSSLGVKHNVTPANCVGVIDCDYRGEILIFLVNNGKDDFTINHGDRIAQLLITPIYTPIIKEVENLEESFRGEGGFGSTGRN